MYLGNRYWSGATNQKGGVGKTTSAVNSSGALTLKGRNVLLVDCDPQGNATTGLGIDKRKAGLTSQLFNKGARAPSYP